MGVQVERAVFISYRGEDSHGYGALLYRDLTDHFGADLVFLDAECIPAGADFADELLGRVRSARVLLAVIGQRWLTAADPTSGRRRIDDPADWIRRELVEAFAAGVRVIPVLTDQAELPCETDLPADIAGLSRSQYRRLRHREPTSDLARIVADLTDLDPDLAAAARGRDLAPPQLPPTVEPPAPPDAVSNGPDVSTPSLDEYLGLLATAARKQWTAAANDRRLVHPAPLPIRWRRSSAPVAGPASAAGYPRFNPLPGLVPIDRALSGGDQDELHQVYGGLPSGRLLLVGPPGSGKSAAAIMLLLDALRYREQATSDEQARIPVPVLFTLHGWHPDRGDSVTDWLAGKLAETYPMFRSRSGRRAATDLLTAGRVAAFLDGLDEIPECTRPGVLDALADAPFRLVLLTRTDEAIAAARCCPLAGALALELQPVTPADAATYLLQALVDPPPAPWQAIHDHLSAAANNEQSGAVSDALTTPLALSLLRDVYGPTDPVDEILDDARFPTAADIENHLLDHAVTAAYTPRPGHATPRYTVATAHRTLRYLATQLSAHDTTDLAWWHLPTWTPHRSRMIMTSALSLVMNVLLYGPALALVFGPALGLAAGLVFGVVTVIAGLIAHHRFDGVPATPSRIGRLTYQSTARSPVFGLVFGLSGGLLAGLSAGLVSGLSAGLVSGLTIGFASAVAGIVINALVSHAQVDDSSFGPADVWRHDRIAGLVYLLLAESVIGLLAALAARLVPGLASGLTSRFWAVLAVGLVVGLVMGLGLVVRMTGEGMKASSPGTAALETALATARLRSREKIPLRLMAFLEDARSRHLLRTVGPVYQFRHATLQHRLAQECRPTGQHL